MTAENPVARLLDDTWDDVLEQAVRDAAVAVDAPMATVSLLTDGLEYFIAHVGLPAELEVSRATARSFSFCRLVIATGAAVVIGNVAEHPGRPELTELFDLRAYVGVPIVVAGVVVGALAGLDTRPRRFNADDVGRLQPLVTIIEARLSQRIGRPEVNLKDAELLPFLRLLQALQLGALSADALSRALRALPPVPVASVRRALVPGR